MKSLTTGSFTTLIIITLVKLLQVYFLERGLLISLLLLLNQCYINKLQLIRCRSNIHVVVTKLLR